MGRIGRVESPLESKGGREGCWGVSFALVFCLAFDFLRGLEDEASIIKLWGIWSSEEESE